MTENLDKKEIIEFFEKNNDEKQLKVFNDIIEYFKFNCQGNLDKLINVFNTGKTETEKYNKFDLSPDIKQKMIEEVMENIEWEKIIKTMDNLGWRYYDKDEIEIGTLVKTALGLLYTVMYKDTNYAETGGFAAEYDDGVLHLGFILTDWEADCEDYTDVGDETCE